MQDSPVPVTAADLAAGGPGAALLALNNAHARELSWLEPDRLRELVTRAFLALRIGEAEAFLLAFDQDAAYDSPNFLWFRARFSRFAYVDRVVVAPAARRRGLAGRLYRDLFAYAASRGHDLVACEVNAVPPNPVSDAFHAALGFAQAGTARISDGRTVRYLTRSLAPARM